LQQGARLYEHRSPVIFMVIEMNEVPIITVLRAGVKNYPKSFFQARQPNRKHRAQDGAFLE